MHIKEWWEEWDEAARQAVTAQGNVIDPRTPNERRQDRLDEILGDTFGAWLQGVEPFDITGV
jgi:hypothetical protein